MFFKQKNYPFIYAGFEVKLYIIPNKIFTLFRIYDYDIILKKFRRRIIVSNKIIFSEKPAKNFNESYLLGNGRSGAAVFGELDREKIALNEDSIWYGKDYDRKNPFAKDSIKDIRKLLFLDKPDEALHLARKTLYGSPKYINPFVPLATLEIIDETPFSSYPDHLEFPVYPNYKRYLNLEEGIVSVEYRKNGVNYKREVFVSYPDDVTVIHLESDTPGSINFSAFMLRRPFDCGGRTFDKKSVIMNIPNDSGGVEASTIMRAVNDGGEIKIYNDTISMENCNSVTLLICTATSFRDNDYTKVAVERIEKVSQICYDELKKRHVDEHSKMFNRTELSLTDNQKHSLLTTEERLENVKSSECDNGLTELMFNYGRYLLMASSRAGSLPSTLQGIWNMSFTPECDSAYTININTQMNYWAAECANLSECHLSLTDFMEKVRERGKVTAKEIYNCRGFVAHHNLNLYGDSDIEGRFNSCVIWPLGGAWLSLHLWEHYAYTLDMDFLKNKAYPILKDAALFFLDYMTEDENGELLTGPSLSPENTYKTKDGRFGTICMAPTMDIQIVRELFNVIIKSCDILGIDEEFKKEIISAKAKLPKDKISSDGRIMEWHKEYEETEKTHRHLSHLFGIYPGETINDDTPELLEAVKKTLKVRTEGEVNQLGWNYIWRACIYARLYDSDNAYKSLIDYSKYSTTSSLMDIVSPAHNVFQIDANLGYPAAVIELLMQSHRNEIKILPALPDQWQDGEVKGIKARGGFELDIKWKNKTPLYVKVKALKSGSCTLIFPNGVCLACGEISGNNVTFKAESGKEYLFSQGN